MLMRVDPWRMPLPACAAPARDALSRALDAAARDVFDEQAVALVVEAGAPLFGRGEAAGHVYALRRGIVRLGAASRSGDATVFGLAGAGDCIGLEALVPPQAYGCDAVACTALDLVRVPAPTLQRLQEQQAPLRGELLRQWARDAERARQWAIELRSGPAHRRLAQLLVELRRHRDDDEGDVWLPGRELMGQMLGLSLETCSRSVSRLRRAGVLAITGRDSARVDFAGLDRLGDDLDFH